MIENIRIQQGKLEEAAPIYRALVRNQPSAAVHQELGQVRMHLGPQEKALK